MTEKADDGRPRPKDAQLHWTLYGGSLDVLHLSTICDDVHTYVCSSLPGCRVCEGKGLVALGPVGAPELAAVTPCPACVAGVPLHPLSYSTNAPRSA